MILRQSVPTGHRTSSGYTFGSAIDIAGGWMNEFVTDAGWLIESIEMLVAKKSGVTADVTLSLYSTDSNFENIALMATKTISSSGFNTNMGNLSGGAFATFTFDTPVKVPANSKLAYVLSAPSALLGDFNIPFLNDAMTDAMVYKYSSNPWSGSAANVGFIINGEVVNLFVPKSTVF